jgi:hypothetical protein
MGYARGASGDPETWRDPDGTISARAAVLGFGRSRRRSAIRSCGTTGASTQARRDARHRVKLRDYQVETNAECRRLENCLAQRHGQREVTARSR